MGGVIVCLWWFEMCYVGLSAPDPVTGDNSLADVAAAFVKKHLHRILENPIFVLVPQL